jgi:hypothetical protein
MPGQHNQSVADDSLHLRHPQPNNRDIAILCRPATDGTGRWSHIDRDQRPTHARQACRALGLKSRCPTGGSSGAQMNPYVRVIAGT